jgi:hypothetical protein
MKHEATTGNLQDAPAGKVQLRIVALIGLVLAGCAMNRQVAKSPLTPAATAAMPSGFLIRNFKDGQYFAGQIGNYRFENMTTRDIAPEMGTAMKAMGIPARSEAVGDSLRPNRGEFVVQGKVRIFNQDNSTLDLIVSGLTLGIIGVIFPGIPYRYECGFEYQFDVSDDHGTFLYSQPPTLYTITYLSIYSFSMEKGCLVGAQSNREEFDRFLAGEIARSVGIRSSK